MAETVSVGCGLSRRALGTVRAGLTLLALASGCAPEPVPGTEWEGAEAQWSGMFFTHQIQPQLWVVVVDDTPSERGRALRAALAEELIGYWDVWRDSDCTRGWDHARYWPEELHVLLIPSSDPAAALHAGIRPDLDLHTENATSTTARSWEEAMAEAILGLESADEEPNLVMAALAFWGDLLSGARPPATAEEEAFLAGLPEDRRTIVLSYGTRDDELSISPDDVSLQTYGGEALLDTPCTSAADAAPRLSQLTSVRCGAPYLRPNLACDLRARCQYRRPVRLDNGQVACRALVLIDEAAECTAEAGWLDPLHADGGRAPRWQVDPEGLSPGRYRQCEVQQLDGRARIACESDVDCLGCQPGFCFREHFAEERHDYLVGTCAARGGWYEEQFRFVLGAESAAWGQGTMVCEIEPASGP